MVAVRHFSVSCGFFGGHNMHTQCEWKIAYESAVTWRRESAKFCGVSSYEQRNEPVFEKSTCAYLITTP